MSKRAARENVVAPTAAQALSDRDRMTSEILLTQLHGDAASIFGIPRRPVIDNDGRPNDSDEPSLPPRPADELQANMLVVQYLVDVRSIRALDALNFDTAPLKAHNATIIAATRAASADRESADARGTHDDGASAGSQSDGLGAGQTPDTDDDDDGGWGIDDVVRGAIDEGSHARLSSGATLWDGDSCGTWEPDDETMVVAPLEAFGWAPIEPTTAAMASLFARAFCADPALGSALRQFDPGPKATIVRVADEKHSKSAEMLLRKAVLPKAGQSPTQSRLSFDLDRTRVGLLTGDGIGLGRHRDEGADRFAWTCLAAGVPIFGVAHDYTRVLPPEMVVSATHAVRLDRLDGHAILTAARWSGEEGLRSLPSELLAEARSKASASADSSTDADTGVGRLVAVLNSVAPLVSWRMLEIACGRQGDIGDVLAGLDDLLRGRVDGYDALPTISRAAADARIAEAFVAQAKSIAGTVPSVHREEDPIAFRKEGWRPQTWEEHYPVPEHILDALGPANEAALKAEEQRARSAVAGHRSGGLANGTGSQRADDATASVAPTAPVAWWDERAGVLRTSADPRDADMSARRPTLERMHGYGAAKTWGLEAAADLRASADGELDWSDLDATAVVLSGPPGTGKTQFAKALARSARVKLIETSVAEWQATDHLGQTLAALKSSFARAKAGAPAILFVDELDGIGSRSNMGDKHALYWSQVVNLLLTEIVELLDHGGVLLVGATNHPEAIDPAVMRSGRFDRHVRIEKPDQADVENILRHYLADDLLTDANGEADAVSANGAGKPSETSNHTTEGAV